MMNPDPRVSPGSRFRPLWVAGALLLVSAASLRAGDLARHLPPAGAPYVAEEVRVRCDDRTSLGGTITLPGRGVLLDGRRLRYAAVLMVGDAGPRDRDGIAVGDTAPVLAARPLYDLTDTLTRRGLAVLRLDDRGVGASTGSPESVTALNRADEAWAALEYLRRRPEVDPGRVAVLGIGEGAASAVLLAALDLDLRGLVLMGASGAPGREVLEWRAREGVSADTSLSASQRDSALAIAMALEEARAQSDPRSRFTVEIDPPPSARTAPVPALILQGGADEAVSRASADRLAGALRSNGQDVAVRVYPGLTDAFLPTSPARPHGAGPARLPDDVLGAAADWLAGRLGPPTVSPGRHRAPVHRAR